MIQTCSEGRMFLIGSRKCPSICQFHIRNQAITAMSNILGEPSWRPFVSRISDLKHQLVTISNQFFNQLVTN